MSHHASHPIPELGPSLKLIQKDAHMEREYDLFERMPNGDAIWRGFVTGLAAARDRLEVLAKQSKNEFFAMYTLPRKSVRART